MTHAATSTIRHARRDLIAIRNGSVRDRSALADNPATWPFVWPMAVAWRRPSSGKAQAPGPELFAKEPQTPLELWDAADYLIRTGQAKKAVPYLDRFLKSQPDDATLIAIRDRYGPGSILRLTTIRRPGRSPSRWPTPWRRPSRRYATRPERIARFIAELTSTPEEQDYAVRRLREAGPYAVPFWSRHCGGRACRAEDATCWSGTWAGWTVGGPALGRRARQPRPGRGGRRGHGARARSATRRPSRS